MQFRNHHQHRYDVYVYQHVINSFFLEQGTRDHGILFRQQHVYGIHRCWNYRWRLHDDFFERYTNHRYCHSGGMLEGPWGPTLSELLPFTATSMK